MVLNLRSRKLQRKLENQQDELHEYREAGDIVAARDQYEELIETTEELIDEGIEVEKYERLKKQFEQSRDDLDEIIERERQNPGAPDTDTDEAANVDGAASSSNATSDGEDGDSPTARSATNTQSDEHGDGDEGAGNTEFEATDPEFDFSDYKGRTDLKEELDDKVVEPFENPEEYRSYGLSTIAGVLFYGPPGTGKSYMARALGGEADATYIEITAADIKHKHVGEPERRAKQLYEEAAEQAPTIVCIQEIDALFTERGDDNNATGKDDLVNQLLEEVEKSPDDVITIGTTNRRDRLDRAATRPGRFTKEFEIGLPGVETRLGVLEYHLKGRPVDWEDLNLKAVGNATEDFSCADLEYLVDEAARNALKMDVPIRHCHFRDAFQNVNPSV